VLLLHSLLCLFLPGGQSTTCSYSELAVAICAAGVPRDVPSLTAAQAESLASRGLAHLGLDEVRRREVETRRLNLARWPKLEAQDDTTADDAALRRLWGSFGLEQLAHDLAYRIIWARKERPPVEP
jgi:hypothetical protein